MLHVTPTCRAHTRPARPSRPGTPGPRRPVPPCTGRPCNAGPGDKIGSEHASLSPDISAMSASILHSVQWPLIYCLSARRIELGLSARRIEQGIEVIFPEMNVFTRPC